MNLRCVDDVPTAFARLLIERDPTAIALSGGSTARECYAAIAGSGRSWSTTTFWFGDERCVPVTDPDSNEGMARAVWLHHVDTGPIRSMVTDPTDPDGDASRYDAALRAAPALDVVHLGLGPDGHTASLFPEAASLGVTDRWVVSAGDALHPHPRLTLTFSGLASARSIVVTVAGPAKQAALARVTAGDPELPASRLVTDAVLTPKTVWLVDDDALGR